MFDKMKKIYELRKQAQVMQKELQAMDIEGESGIVKVVISGEQKIKNIDIDKEQFNPDDLESLERDLKEALSRAIDRSQKIAAEKMKAITGDLGLPGL